MVAQTGFLPAAWYHWLRESPQYASIRQPGTRAALQVRSVPDLEHRVHDLRKMLRTDRPFDALSDLYVTAIDQEIADQAKADRLLDVRMGTVRPVAERRDRAKKFLHGAAPVQMLRDALGTIIDEEGAHTLVPRDGSMPKLTLHGFQRLLSGAIRDAFPTAVAAERAFGMTHGRIGYTRKSRSRDHAPYQHLWRVPSDLLTILHGLHAETVREQTGSRWRAAYHLWHRDGVLRDCSDPEFLRKIIGAAPNAETRLRQALQILLPETQVGAIMAEDRAPLTYQGFAQQVVNGMYAYLRSYYAIAAAFGITAGSMHRIHMHDTEPHRQPALPKILSIQDFTDAYAARALQRYRRRVTASKALSVNMYLLEERAARGKQVLKERNFRQWVRNWLPDDSALERTELTHVQARDRYIAAVCGRVGNLSLAAEALECSSNGLSQRYDRAHRST